MIGRIWWGINTAFLAAAVFSAILAVSDKMNVRTAALRGVYLTVRLQFKETRAEQIQQASRFLPT